MARRAHGRFLRFEPLHRQRQEQGEDRHLRIAHDREAADIWYVGGLDMDPSAERHDLSGRHVDVRYRDITDPAGRGAGLPVGSRLLHQPRDGRIADREQRVAHVGQGGVPRAPAHDGAIELPGGCRVCRHQFIPDETASRIGHCGLLPLREWVLPMRCDGGVARGVQHKHNARGAMLLHRRVG
jgi:hypothetical protein